MPFKTSLFFVSMVPMQAYLSLGRCYHQLNILTFEKKNGMQTILNVSYGLLSMERTHISYNFRVQIAYTQVSYLRDSDQTQPLDLLQFSCTKSTLIYPTKYSEFASLYLLQLISVSGSIFRRARKFKSSIVEHLFNLERKSLE